MVLISIVKAFEIVSELLLEDIIKLSVFPTEFVLLKSVHVLLRNDSFGGQGKWIQSNMRNQTKRGMVSDSRLELRISGSKQNWDDSPAESDNTFFINFLSLLNKWQQF